MLGRTILRSQRARLEYLAERPWSARRGIHGPKRFRTLLAAQGWCGEHWSDGHVEIRHARTGETYRRDEEGNWQRQNGIKHEEEAETDENLPYWKRPPLE